MLYNIFLYRFSRIISIFCGLSSLKIIEVLSLAEGKIIPQGRIKFVQHLEGGIVEEILINEGEKVKINQPLVILSKKKASSEYEEINTRLKSIELSILRVDSEKKSKNEIMIPDNKKKIFGGCYTFITPPLLLLAIINIRIIIIIL